MSRLTSLQKLKEHMWDFREISAGINSISLENTERMGLVVTLYYEGVIFCSPLLDVTVRLLPMLAIAASFMHFEHCR